ncbi:MAG: MFS transporter [Succiniclasticum sp.]|nr:MFS transporter [Succiniclasticum sp.]MDY6086757.1 MFS transporter [Succiniclasticum sp.]
MKKMNSAVYLFSLGHFATDWAQGAIPALLPCFIQNYNLSYRAAAALIFANVLISSLLQPVFGYYSDRISRPWFVPLGPVLCGTAITAIGFSTTYEGVFLASALSGIGSAIFHPEGALMVNRVSGKAKGQALGIFSVGGNAGFAVGPIVAGFCAYKIGIHSLVLFGIINLLLGAALSWQMSSVLRQVAAQKQLEAENAGAEEKKNDWNSFGKLFFAILARSLSFTLSNTFIPIYWITVLHTSATQGTTALSILFTLGAVITFVGGVISDRFGFVKVIRAAFICMVPTYLLLTHTTNVWLATALLFPAAISIFLPYSPIVVLGQTYLAKNAGFASGITLGLSTTLGGIFAPLVGWAADIWGLVPALQIFWITGLLGAVAAFTLPLTDGHADKGTD